MCCKKKAAGFVTGIWGGFGVHCFYQPGCKSQQDGFKSHYRNILWLVPGSFAGFRNESDISSHSKDSQRHNLIFKKKEKRTKKKEKKQNTVNKQCTASMLLGINCPCLQQARTIFQGSAFLTRGVGGCRFLMLPPKMSYQPEFTAGNRSKGPLTSLRSDASYSKESSSIPAPS